MKLGIHRARGFTLIELMIVVAVIGILAAVAYPSFQESVRKAKRADAKEALLRIQLAQEKFRANNPTYAASLTNAPDAADPANRGLGFLSTASVKGYYNLAIVGAPTATSFTATATMRTPALGGFSDAKCPVMSIVVTPAGEQKWPVPVGGYSCW